MSLSLPLSLFLALTLTMGLAGFLEAVQRWQPLHSDALAGNSNSAERAARLHSFLCSASRSPQPPAASRSSPSKTLGGAHKCSPLWAPICWRLAASIRPSRPAPPTRPRRDWPEWSQLTRQSNVAARPIQMNRNRNNNHLARYKSNPSRVMAVSNYNARRTRVPIKCASEEGGEGHLK